MSEGLDKLKSIGAQKIHEDTHIAIQHIQAILNEDFSSLSRVQFLGFLSIIEREYGINLDEFKNTSSEHFKSNNNFTSSESHLFVVAKKQRNYTPFYILAGLSLFAGVAFMSLDFTPQNEESYIEESKVIKDVKKEVQKKIQIEKRRTTSVDIQRDMPQQEEILKVQTQTSTQEKQESSVEEQKRVQPTQKVKEAPKEEEYHEDPAPILEHQLLITPRKKVWLGYINLKTGKKSSLVIKSMLALDLKDDHLFVFGHGNVDVELDAKEFHFKSNRPLRLLFKNGKFEQISLRKFKSLNKGKKW